MKVLQKKLSGVLEIIPQIHGDERGFLVRLFDKKIFGDLGINTDRIQETLVGSSLKNTLRGLHISLPPSTEGKMVTVISGKMLWVTVDVRKGSETFGQHETTVLSGEERNILSVPRGFAHGCLSLTDDSLLLTNADNNFSDQHSTGVIWNDEHLGIDWGLEGAVPIISEGHKKYPPWSAFLEKYQGI